MREIEIITRITNDFICDSHGTIVTEYCKRQSTWETFRDEINYTLSESFIQELIPETLVLQSADAAKKDQKETNDLQTVMHMITKGSTHWEKVLTEGIRHSLLSYQEQSAVKHIIQMAATGAIPSSRTGKLPHKIMEMVNASLAAEEKLIAEGIII